MMQLCCFIIYPVSWNRIKYAWVEKKFSHNFQGKQYGGMQLYKLIKFWGIKIKSNIFFNLKKNNKNTDLGFLLTDHRIIPMRGRLGWGRKRQYHVAGTSPDLWLINSRVCNAVFHHRHGCPHECWRCMQLGCYSVSYIWVQTDQL